MLFFITSTKYNKEQPYNPFNMSLVDYQIAAQHQ